MMTTKQTAMFMLKDLFGLSGDEKEQRKPTLVSMMNEISHPCKSLFEYTKTLVTYLPTLDTRITDSKLSAAIDNAMEAIVQYAPKTVLRRDTIDGRWSLYENVPELSEVISLLYTYYDKASVDELAQYIGRKTA